MIAEPRFLERERRMIQRALNSQNDIVANDLSFSLSLSLKRGKFEDTDSERNGKMLDREKKLKRRRRRRRKYWMELLWIASTFNRSEWFSSCAPIEESPAV